MNARSPKSRADIWSSVALFATILILSVVLAVTTDLNMVVRGAVAVLAGIVAAATVHTISSRRSPSDEH